MNVDVAAKALDALFRPFPWFHAVGIGAQGNVPVLFVYVKSLRHKELVELGEIFMDVPVVIRLTGSVKASG